MSRSEHWGQRNLHAIAYPPNSLEARLAEVYDRLHPDDPDGPGPATLNDGVQVAQNSAPSGWADYVARQARSDIDDVVQPILESVRSATGQVTGAATQGFEALAPWAVQALPAPECDPRRPDLECREPEDPPKRAYDDILRELRDAGPAAPGVVRIFPPDHGGALATDPRTFSVPLRYFPKPAQFEIRSKRRSPPK